MILNDFIFEFNLNGFQGDSGGGLVQYLNEYESRAVLIGIDIHFYAKKPVQEVPNPPCYFEHIGQAFCIRVAKHLFWIYENLRN